MGDTVEIRPEALDVFLTRWVEWCREHDLPEPVKGFTARGDELIGPCPGCHAAGYIGNANLTVQVVGAQ